MTDYGIALSAWAPFCAAIERLARWQQDNTDLDEPQDRLAARADALGQLVAVFEDGEADPLPLSELIRLRGLPDAEAMALDLCQERVLDVGAGSGVHSLVLQQEGHAVTALDGQDELVAHLRSCGVEDTRCGDIYEPAWRTEGETWDTALFMMNGLGLSGDIQGLHRLLHGLHAVVAANGCVLADGCDLRGSPAPEEADRIRLRQAAGRHFGEAVLHMVFSGSEGEVVGAPFPWLYLDYTTLAAAADATGWSSQCVYSAGPEYLARLTH